MTPMTERFEQWWAEELEDVPTLATSTGAPGPHDRWTDLTRDAIDARHRRDRRWLAELDDAAAAQPGLAGNDPDDRLSLDVLRRQLRTRVDAQRFPTELLAIGCINGVHELVPRILEMTPPEHVEARADAVGALVDQTIALLREGLDAGVTQPHAVASKAQAQVESAASRPHDPHAVNPHLARLAAFLADRYVPACRTEPGTEGLHALPDGDAWYAHEVRRYTTVEITPQQVHDLGLAEVERIRADMHEAMRATGWSGDLDSFCEHLRTDDRFFHTDPDELLAEYRAIAKRIDPGLPALFGALPRLPYGVKPVPDHEAPTTTTAYYLRGSPAAGRPGWFLANTWDLRSRPRWEMEALTLHEAVPGHHLQIALAAELPGVATFRRHTGPTAFVEGWGLYAESLGPELGCYEDPHSRFGALTYDLWRAVRLVVDTGMHALGWSRQQAVDWFAARSSKPRHDIEVEIDRYLSWPGQALAYKVGQLRIQQLRHEAERAPGFDIRAFHDLVLGSGALPLDLLAEQVRGAMDAPSDSAGAPVG